MEAPLGELQGVFLAVDVPLGQCDAHLKFADAQIAVGNLGVEDDQGVPVVFDRGLERGVRGLHIPADASPQVQLPTGIESHGVDVRGPVGGDGSARGIAETGGIEASGSVDGGEIISLGDASDGRGLLDTREGGLEIEIVCGGLMDQIGEDLVIEDGPPFIQKGGPLRGALFVGRFRGGGMPGFRVSGFRALVVGAHHAAGQAHQEQERGGESERFHHFTSNPSAGGGGIFGVFPRSAPFATIRYSIGTASRLMTVEISMPAKTVVPMTRRLMAPAPVATIRGITPRMKEKAVIRTARNRRRAASMAASKMEQFFSSRCVLANSTIRMGP